MILDSIKNINHYIGLYDNLDRAINYLNRNDISVLAEGKNEIYGDDVFVIINKYETQDEADCFIETHNKYIDIQIMLRGEEKIGFAVLDNQTVKTPYDEIKDYTFYKAELEYFILHEGYFAIFLPTDLHSPSIKIDESQKVKKAVVKVKIG